jgi:exosortase/archaeosortase family protein
MSQVTDSYLEGKIYQKLILYAAIAFIVLPFMTTFNEFLTKVVESLHFVNAMQSVAAPFVVKTLVVILRAIGMPAAIDGSHLYLTGGWMPVKVYINWNCIGWQSFILLALTIVTGLQGPYTRRSKLVTILIGLEGTFLVNIVRILIPTLLAYHMGYIPAIIFHDYMGTLLTLLWIGGFWSYSFGNILVKRGGADAGESLPLDGPIQAMKKGGKMDRDLDRGEA